MKAPLLLSLFLATSMTHAQQKLPVIKASSVNAHIMEGDDDRYNWRLSPEIRPDVHRTNKIVKPKWIRFYTDCDSIKVHLKPGAHFDFVVLLNGKDSCRTRLESPALKNDAALKPVRRDTIPFVLTEFNNIRIKTVVNHTDTLYLKFDSGTTGLVLTREAIKTKTHQLNTDGAHLQIGGMAWDSLEVYPVQLSGQGTDGRFGWDLFDGKVVEIDYDKNLFIVHSKAPSISTAYARFDMEYTHTLFCIRAKLQLQNKTYANRYLFDNGYQRTLMLDTTIMREQHYPTDLEVIKKVVMKDGQGREFPVLTVKGDRFVLGSHALQNVPVQLLTLNNPARFKTHILGNEVLKRFNTFLDFQKNVVYLKPNSLSEVAYTDAK